MSGDTHEIDSVPVRVEQLTGSPGDVVLTHPWLLHVTSSNAGPVPRFMRVKLLYHADSDPVRPR